jgi:hypothetical protein
MTCGIIVRIPGEDGAAVETVAGINATPARTAMMSADSLVIAAPDGHGAHSKYTTNSDRTEYHQQPVPTHHTRRSAPAECAVLIVHRR